MATLRQKTSFGPGIYRGHKFDADRLRQFAEGTNRAIAAGIPIPLLKHHAKINADDNATLDAAKADGAGWVTKVEVEADGSLAWEAKDVPDEVAAGVESGSIKFTSPEFRPSYESEKAGVYEGPVIRHFAFTPIPGNPHQGAIETVALEELPGVALQFAEEERQPLETVEETQHAESEVVDITPSDATRSRGDSETPLEPKENPDMPPKATDRSKLSAVIAGLKRKDIVLPSDFDFTDDSAIDVLLGCINSSLSAENKAEIENAAEESDEDQNQPVEASMPFSEGISDGPRHLDTLKSHGYKLVHVGKSQHHWEHPKTGHSIAVSAFDGAWSHNGKDMRNVTSERGKDYGKTLNEHLKKVHSSQHSEEGSEQFGEDSLHHALLGHGYKQVRSVKVGRGHKTYEKPGEHTVFTNHLGEWLHNHSSSKGSAVEAGKGHGSLKKHLAKIHSSQHDEEEVEQFSEEEINALPPKFQAQIRSGLKKLEEERTARIAAEAKAIQYAEQEEKTKNAAARERALTTIGACSLPPVLRKKLMDSYSTIQFAEGNEQPTFTAAEVAKMVAASLPKSLQFEEKDVEEAAAPKVNKVVGKDAQGNPIMGESSSEQFFEADPEQPGHVSPSRAEELVRGNPVFRMGGASNWERPTLDKSVAEHTATNPSRVMNT